MNMIDEIVDVFNKENIVMVIILSVFRNERYYL